MTEFGFSGEDLINQGIRDFEYFDRLQKGLIQPHTVTGKRIIDPDTDHGKKIMESFEKRPKWTIDQKVKQRLNKQPYGIGRVKSEWEIKKEVRKYYTARLLSLNDCIWGSFKLSRDEKESKKQIREAKKWLFKSSEVFAFEKKHGLDRSIKHTPCDPPEPTHKFLQAQYRAVSLLLAVSHLCRALKLLRAAAL